MKQNPSRKFRRSLIAVPVVLACLALPTTSASAAPAATVQSIAVNQSTSCALFTDGSVKCWGNNNGGQLQVPQCTGYYPRCLTGQVSQLTTPTAMTGTSGATRISMGNGYVCVLIDNGTIKCWGSNGGGRLGDGTDTPRSSPTLVSGISNATQVSAGFGSTCAVLAGGGIKCWGSNGDGQIGDGTTSERRSPVSVSGISNAVQVAVGGQHACALLSDGTVKCWGYNNSGQIGDGTRTSRTTPVSVSGISSAVSIGVGNDTSCAVLSNGAVNCWGSNGIAAIGDGTQIDRWSPTATSGITTATKVVMGFNGPACATLSDGTVKCWGFDSFGQLGDGGGSSYRMTPVTFSGASGAVDVAVGSAHSCVLISGGTVKCVGDNGVGQIGDGTTTRRLAAVTTIAGVVDTTAPTTPGSFTGVPSGVTSSTSATIGFTLGESGGRVECKLDSGSWAACTSVSGTSGSQSLTGLADGTHTLSVRHTDIVGNVSQVGSTSSWTVDATSPSTPGSFTGVPSSPTNSASATVGFTLGEAGGTVECKVDSGSWGSCTSVSGTTGSKGLTSLADGTHTLSVRQTDAAGNVSQVGTTGSWTVDTTAPSRPGSFTGVPSSPTNSASATIGFTLGEAGGTVECKVDNGSWSSCTSVSGTSGSRSLSALADGSHTLSVRQTDSAGNVSQVGTTSSWTVDRTPPEAPSVTRTSPSAHLSNQTNASVTYSGEAGASFVCSFDGGSWSACGGSPVSFSNVADGLHTLSVKAVDAAGNQSQASTVSWDVDTVPHAAPVVDLSSPTSSLTNSTSATVAWEGVTGATYLCSLDGAAFSTCPDSPTTLTGLGEGSHTFSVKARDGVGNLSDAGSVTWRVDLTAPAAPTLKRESPSSSPSNSTTASISYSGEEGATFTCSLDGGAWRLCEESPEDLAGLADGSHTLRVRATDVAGNTGASASVTWQVDTTAPAAPTISGLPGAATALTAATLAFSGEAGAGFTCSLDGAAFAACTSPVALTGLAVGPHTFAVKATDAAGNTGAAGTVTWTVLPPAGQPTLLAPPAGTKTVYKADGKWAIKVGLLFSTGGNPNPAAQLMTVQVWVDSSGKPLSTKPSDSEPIPTTASFTKGVLAWDASGEVSRPSVAAPVWVRVGNRAGKWTGWVKLTA